MQSVYLNPLTDFGFKKLFGEEPHEVIYLAQFTPKERKAYEDSIKYYRDLKNSYDTAHQEGWVEGLEAGEQIGMEKGRAEGEQIGVAKGAQQTIIKMVQGMHANGLDLKTIAAVTELTATEISALLS
jgi:flagellar biosynthesis/type III secretory pathway protein FliH